MIMGVPPMVPQLPVQVPVKCETRNENHGEEEEENPPLSLFQRAKSVRDSVRESVEVGWKRAKSVKDSAVNKNFVSREWYWNHMYGPLIGAMVKKNVTPENFPECDEAAMWHLRDNWGKVSFFF